MDLNAGMIGYWPLGTDCHDHSEFGNHGIPHNIDFGIPRLDGRAGRAAAFDGRSAYIEVPHSESLQIGSDGFAISLWVHTTDNLDDVIGDLISKYDPARRMGFNLNLQSTSCVSSQSNYRHLAFGIDNSLIDPVWTDCGRPGNAIFVSAMAVSEGHLYVGTCESDSGEHGHVYRFDGAGQWTDCGLPTPGNIVWTLASYLGNLYAGAGSYDPRGSLLAPAANMAPDGHVYRYEGGSTWRDCGQPGGSEAMAVNSLFVYQGILYSHTNKELYRYAGDSDWVFCSPGKGYVNFIHNGHIYTHGGGGGAHHGPVVSMYRLDDSGDWISCGAAEKTVQIYSIVSYRGDLYIGTWPTGTVFRWDGDDKWIDCGRLGNELEVMGMTVYNGKLYAGTLPLAQVYRYDGGTTWTLTGQLDTTPNVNYRRAWSFATYQGNLYCGTLPSGHVYALEAGRNVTYDYEFGSGWRHIVAVKDGELTDCRLKLYVDGELAVASPVFNQGEVWVGNSEPLLIGFGAQDYFNGSLADIRLYKRALNEEEVKALATAQT